MDEKFVKEEHLDQLSPIMVQDEQDEAELHSEYMTTLREDLERKQELDNSEWNGIIQKKNSSYMEAVKSANESLHQYLLHSMPTNREELEKGIADITVWYDALIDTCRVYLVKRKRAITPTGRARFRMVKQMLNMALAEKSRLRESAYDVFLSKDFGSDVLWANTLNETRRANIYSDRSAEGHTEGGTSELTILNVGTEVFFFKEESTLKSVDERIKEEIIDNPEYKDKRTQLEALKPYMTGNLRDPATTVLKSIGTKPEEYNPQKALKEFNSTMQMLDPDFKPLDSSYGEIILRICPKFALIVTSAGCAKDARIMDGGSLGVRNVATSRLAEAFGISELIAESKTVNVIRTEKDGKQTVEKGNAMKKAEGESIGKVVKQGDSSVKTVTYTPEAVRKLNILRIFDVICGQIDRNGSNVYYTSEKRGDKVVITGVQGIDNDMSFGCLNYAELSQYKTGVLQMRPLEAEGEVLIRSVDKDFAASVLVIEDNYVKKLMMDILSEDEINSLIDRLHGVQALLRSGKVAIVDQTEWTAEHAKEVVGKQAGNKPVYLENVKVEE